MSSKPRLDLPDASVLAASAMRRLALAVALSALLWIAVYWALAS